MKMTVERARLVAYWTWGCSDSSCGICRRAFDACCPDCKVPGDDCPVIWGKSTHSFHLHCIHTWTNVQEQQSEHRHTCPLCRRPWEFG
mmetsp:Transcript_12716/g.18375  ORF Transcript_12716/g.18375 Transcript_12716/m.18375 type:complete len:88 (+) Transcript_12716:158-421(+)